VAGRKIVVASSEQGAETPAAGATAGPGGPHGAQRSGAPADLRAEAMADAAVQAMLDVFPAEISDVEEM
jgi:hypothetical protein